MKLLYLCACGAICLSCVCIYELLLSVYVPVCAFKYSVLMFCCDVLLCYAALTGGACVLSLGWKISALYDIAKALR